MLLIIPLLSVLGPASLIAAVPNQRATEHLWHRRNSSTDACPSDSGMLSASGTSIWSVPSSTEASASSNSSALSPAASDQDAAVPSAAAPSAGSSADTSGTSTGLQAASHCGQYEAVQTGDYSIQNLLWGENFATSGSQCFGVDGLNGNTVAWHSDWTWVGSQYNVKSYSNANLIFTPKQLSAVSSIPTKWSYESTGSNFVADISYDMFLADSTANAANVASVGDARSYEIMVWLAAIGIEPTSSTGSDPLTTTTIGGTTWKLYKGPSGSTTVFSFVADSQITDYSGDLNDFYKYLIASQGVSGDQYLAYIGAGTEPFVGSNVQLKTTAYSCAVN